MAAYTTAAYLMQGASVAFNEEHGPGVAAPHSGVYRCMRRHREIAIAEGGKLPPQQHHSHNPDEGAVRGRLIVWADHKPK
jgi:hypothetical protein